jgi:hypothetical protein
MNRSLLEIRKKKRLLIAKFDYYKEFAYFIIDALKEEKKKALNSILAHEMMS